MSAPKNKIVINKANFVSYKSSSISSDYTFGKTLGSGAFGTARVAVHRVTGQTRVVKILKKSEHDEEKLFLEVDILARLSHPNIMQVFEFYDDNSNNYIVSEYCQGGELFECISEKGIFTEEEAKVLIRQLLSAVCYSHQNNIVHRDIKPENILLEDKGGDLVIKLIDWGCARYFSKNKKLTKVSGTPYYIAPEVLDEAYDEKCDIWSSGVILYVLLCGYPPFNGETDTEILKNVKKGKYDFPREEWDSVSKEAKDFVSSMLKYDPKDRLSSKECLNHPWIRNLEIKSDKNLAVSVLKNMKQFKISRQLETATVSYIVSQIVSKEERSKLMYQFVSWDKNGDGVLSRDEVYEGYKQLYGEVVANEEVDKLMQNIDLDGNGYIDYNEFLNAALNKDKVLSKQNLELAFQAFDKNGNGKISLEEILLIFNQSNVDFDKSVFDNIIKEADENGDGEISFEEFKRIMTKFFS